jgi:hypothetical protein
MIRGGCGLDGPFREGDGMGDVTRPCLVLMAGQMRGEPLDGVAERRRGLLSRVRKMDHVDGSDRRRFACVVKNQVRLGRTGCDGVKEIREGSGKPGGENTSGARRDLARVQIADTRKSLAQSVRRREAVGEERLQRGGDAVDRSKQPRVGAIGRWRCDIRDAGDARSGRRGRRVPGGFQDATAGVRQEQIGLVAERLQDQSACRVRRRRLESPDKRGLEGQADHAIQAVARDVCEASAREPLARSARQRRQRARLGRTRRARHDAR